MSDETKTEMGRPPEGADVPVQGLLPGDTDGFEFAREVEDPTDPTAGGEPGYIQRASETRANRGGGKEEESGAEAPPE